MTTATEISHVRRNEFGVPVIENTGVKVVEVVLTKQANDLTAEEVVEFLPHLSLSQIYAALSFYFDHQDELDADMESRRQFAEEQAQRSKTPTRREWLEQARRRGVSVAK